MNDSKIPNRILIILILSSLIFIIGVKQSHADHSQDLDEVAAPVFTDLVVGVPGEDIPGSPSAIENAGAIHYIYSSPAGLGPLGNQIVHQGLDWVDDQAESEDQYGSALASGDFNGDGNFDVAVGIPFENVNGNSGLVVSAGAVHIIYGSGSWGQPFLEDQFIHQDSLNIEGSAELSDQFGRSLAVGNFNGDDYDDLAIGIPFEDFEYSTTVTNAGSVIVIYGSSGGLSPTAVLPDQMWHQDSPNIVDSVEDYDWFGHALAAGDFDNDGFDDLAIGAPGEDSEAAGKNDIGVVHVLYGTLDGLSAVGSQQWEQYDWGGSVESESYDNFGWSLAAGVFRWIGHDSLAIGVPNEDIDTWANMTDAGAVNILYGSSSGLDDAFVDFIYQDGGYVDETAETGDRFGYTLAAADISGYGVDALIVGVPYEDLGDPLVSNAGAVHVILHSSPTGWLGANGRYLHQGRSTIPDELEQGDMFGYSLAVGDFNRDGKEDVAIGVPYDSCHHSEDGSVIVVYDEWWPNPDFPTQRFCQGDGLVDQAEAGDHFGLSLVTVPSNDLTVSQLFLPIALGNH